MGTGRMSGASPDGAQIRSPLLARRILARVIPARLRPTAAGDFEEMYGLILRKNGPGKAALWYWGQVVKSVPVFFFNNLYWRMSMFMNYLKLALRHMRRRPEFAAVNLAGLAIGLAACILAVLFVQDEFAYDRFHSHVERIFEVRSEIGTGDEAISLTTSGPIGPALASGFPEVEAATRLAKTEVVIRKDDQAVLRDGLGVDPSFFTVFSFPLAMGDASGALGDPYSVILGRETARQLFGSEDPMGRTLSLKIGNEIADYRVTGVAQKIPARSSLSFDLLVPIQRVKGPLIDQWGAGPDGSQPDAYCFIRLREGVRADDLSARFPGSLDRHLSTAGKPGRHFLAPFAAYHRGIGDYPFSFLLKPRSSPLFSSLLLSIAFLILLVAGFNFMNLSLGAAVHDRVKEIGLRKVFGAERKNLFHQFRIEGALLSLTALAGGLGLAAIVLPAFNRFAGKDLRLDFQGAGGPLCALILLAVTVGAGAGSYPGWAMARTRPIDLFRGSFLPGRRGGFNRAMLIFQFGVSIFLVTTAIFLFLQRRFLLTTDPGYETEQIAVLDLRQAPPGTAGGSDFLSVLKPRLLAHPEIQSVSGSESALTNWSAMFFKKASASTPNIIRWNEVDADYREVLGLRINEGRWFSPEDPKGLKGAIVVNETFARLCGPESPVGKSIPDIFANKLPARIIGVVRDFHFDSFHQAIQPAMISLSSSPSRWAYIRLKGENLHQAVAVIEREFKAIAPGIPFLYGFLDEQTARLYEKESRWSVMIGLVSLFAVLIACAGVFGLAIQSSARKRKEIGIRRVLGASARQVAGLMNREFLRAAAAAVLLAWPAAFLAVRKILAPYPYRISPSLWVFLAGTVVIMGLVALTVNLQTFRAARANPVVTLRNE